MSFDRADEIDIEATRLAEQFREYVTRHNRLTTIYAGVGLSKFLGGEDDCIHCEIGAAIQAHAAKIPDGPEGAHLGNLMVKKIAEAIGQFFSIAVDSEDLLQVVRKFSTDILNATLRARKERTEAREQAQTPNWPQSPHKPGRA